jgi:transposase
MREYIMAGCDLSDKSMLVQMAQHAGPVEKRSFGNSPGGRSKMIAYLRAWQERSGGAAIHFAYEAGPHGFGLHDVLTESGIVCHVLAPTRLPQSSKSRWDKTDEKDALRIFEVVRGHLLAGNALPNVWVPDVATRDDRERVRARLDVGGKTRRVRTQIRMLVKRHMIGWPRAVGKHWTRAARAWLRGLCEPSSELGPGGRTALGSLLDQMEWLEGEQTRLDQAVEELAESDRYRSSVAALTSEMGVGVLTAMVFLSEMGDLSRFPNRRVVGAYLGVVPRTYETGKRDDCKGHITHQGSSRVRAVLCQAVWVRVRRDAAEKVRFNKIVREHPKRKKVALVAGMRRLSIVLWHRGLAAAAERPPSRPPQGGRRQPSLRGQARAGGRRWAPAGEHRPAP